MTIELSVFCWQYYIKWDFGRSGIDSALNLSGEVFSFGEHIMPCFEVWGVWDMGTSIHLFAYFGDESP